MFKNQDQVDKMVESSQLLASASFEPLAEKHPVLKGFDRQNWNLLMTIAFIYEHLNLVSPEVVRHGDLGAPLEKSVREWNPRASDSMLDIGAFMRGFREQGAHEDKEGIGGWVIWRLRGGFPGFDEMFAAPDIGEYVLNEVKKSLWAVELVA